MEISASAGLGNQVTLFFKCENLANMDSFSKSDPFLVVSLKQGKNGDFKTIGKTEVIKDELNPNFSTTFVVDYMFEVAQTLKVVCFDWDSDDKADVAGEATFTIGSIMGSKGHCLTQDLVKDGKKKSMGKLIVRAEEVVVSRDILGFQFIGKKLANKDGFFGKSDPFLKFYRLHSDDDWVKVHETEYIKDDLNPTWSLFETKASLFCHGDFYTPMKVECFDYDKDGGHDYIGEFQANTHDLFEKKEEGFQLLDVKKKNKKTGKIFVVDSFVRQEYTFLDYLRSGFQVSFGVAIDYTASNGTPNNPNSLHYLGGPVTPYEEAISRIGTIISAYDSDGMFPVQGFGAKINGATSHSFSVNGDAANPNVPGVDAILAAYRDSFNFAILDGPTLFAPILGQTIERVKASVGSHVYTVLLILTDGAMHDHYDVIDLLVSASSLPLSVIIIGIGNADFKKMELLDADKSALKDSKGNVAQRDIVQFVPFNKYAQEPELLAQETLKEVPRQFLNYVKIAGIQPPQIQSTDQFAPNLVRKLAIYFNTR